MNNKVAYLELFGITMAGVRRPDRGIYWTDLTGWWGLPDLRGDADNIPGGHGRFRRTEFYRDSRAITLTGHILTDSNQELVSVRDRLEAALSAGFGVMKVVTTGTGSWEREVEIDTLTIEPDHGREWTKFIVDMVAPDPRRYGPLQTVGPVDLPSSVGGVRLPQQMPWNFGTVSSGGRLVIHNGGAIELSPVFMVSGGFSQVSILDVTTGRRLRLVRPVVDSPGVPVVFDSDVRRVTQGAAELTRWLTRREWFTIPAGDTHEYRFEVTDREGDPQMWGKYKIGAW